jgi:leucyl-tRNA synthetase
MESFVLLLSPMAPHISEELWQALGHSESLSHAAWPTFDSKYVQESAIEMPVQINGRVRGRITIPVSATNAEMEKTVLNDPRIKKYLEGSSVRKVIVVPKSSQPRNTRKQPKLLSCASCVSWLDHFLITIGIRV